MVQTIEEVTEVRDLFDLCTKYMIMPVPQPIMVFSRIAEILYKTNKDANYAICGCDAKTELVKYENKKELKDYCKKNKFDLVDIVSRDGSGTIMRVDAIR